jgi:anti-sigma28 factor (negative regulator of flagellin synthesis)
MNLKIESDRLEGAGALQNSPTPAGRRAADAAPARDIKDSASISDLSAKVANAITTEQTRVDNRVSELAALYARGEYRPDAKAVSKAMVDNALPPKDGANL